jgi:predicted transcriptional regulator
LSAVPDNVVQFSLPKKPKIREKEPMPDQRKLAVIPIRALTDRAVTDGMVKTLALICSYCNRAGVTWVSQARLAKDAGVSRQAVSKHITKLKAQGYLEVVSKHWRGVRPDTVRVIYDASIDLETAIAVTSRHEDTRPPHIKEKEMKEMTPDPEGLKRIHDMINGVIKPVQQPPREYQMPKGDTVTVAKMKEQIAKKKQSQASNAQPEVAYGDEKVGTNVQPMCKPEVALNTENISIDKVLRLFLNKGFNVLSNQESIQHIADSTTVAELETLMDKLSERYAAEGLPLPTDGAMLANDLIMLQSDELTARHGI